jgi:hypothetical protein
LSSTITFTDAEKGGVYWRDISDKWAKIVDKENDVDTISKLLEQYKAINKASCVNDGGSTDYYKVPQNAIDLQDLIEYKNMNWNIANIFKACYRLGECTHSDTTRDLNKIKWFIDREIKRVSK